MPLDYPEKERLHEDRFASLENWYHEGIGQLKLIEGGGLHMDCIGSRQGGPGCMAFFRPDLPDQVAVSYEVVVHGHGGLIINYLAIRGLQGEDLIEDAEKLAPRDACMRNYFAKKWGLQSYHLSYSRFDDEGNHTETSNWRRNPGLLLAGHGPDPVKELGKSFHVRITKDAGFLQFFVDGQFAHGVMDRDTGRYPIPDWGKFGIRLIGSEVRAEFRNFQVYRIPKNALARRNLEDEVSPDKE